MGDFVRSLGKRSQANQCFLRPDHEQMDSAPVACLDATAIMFGEQRFAAGTPLSLQVVMDPGCCRVDGLRY
ncbi:hypothetical protein GCM10007173_23790 [Glutamicibacter ardleyensis]|uniref:Transposase n=1 Tax=Glutamicibacter ardleyensis TaxID=225894 RepID=A0ABQ2DNX9_9MICC|nr:hypothetical protein GCM10007173_23790 [Glutamicibacter ardleyensis]